MYTTRQTAADAAELTQGGNNMATLSDITSKMTSWELGMALSLMEDGLDEATAVIGALKWGARCEATRRADEANTAYLVLCAGH
jgi:hypothetical protein